MSETQALIQHDDSPTAILSKKLRSLMQYNALQQGYLPSSSQIEEHLAAVVQSPLLNTRQRGLSRQTKIVLEDTRNFFKALGQLVKDKNQDDIVQEIIWNLRGANLESEIDGDIFAARLDAATAKADAKTGKQNFSPCNVTYDCSAPQSKSYCRCAVQQPTISRFNS